MIKRALLILLQVGVPIAVIVTIGVELLQDGALKDTNVPPWGYAVAVIVVVPFFVLGFVAVIELVIGLAVLFALAGQQREVTGRAIRVRHVGESPDWWVALDDGTNDEVVAYRVRIPHSIQAGDYVRLRVRPLTGEVKSAEIAEAHTPDYSRT